MSRGCPVAKRNPKPTPKPQPAKPKPAGRVKLTSYTVALAMRGEAVIGRGGGAPLISKTEAKRIALDAAFPSIGASNIRVTWDNRIFHRVSGADLDARMALGRIARVAYDPLPAFRLPGRQFFAGHTGKTWWAGRRVNGDGGTIEAVCADHGWRVIHVERDADGRPLSVIAVRIPE